MATAGSTRFRYPGRRAWLRSSAAHVRSFELTPADFGVEPADAAALRGGDTAENAAIARAILEGERGPRRDAVLVNAGAALCVAGVASSPRDGADRARQTIESGAARAKLDAWAAFGR